MSWQGVDNLKTFTLNKCLRNAVCATRTTFLWFIHHFYAICVFIGTKNIYPTPRFWWIKMINLKIMKVSVFKVYLHFSKSILSRFWNLTILTHKKWRVGSDLFGPQYTYVWRTSAKTPPCGITRSTIRVSGKSVAKNIVVVQWFKMHMIFSPILIPKYK